MNRELHISHNRGRWQRWLTLDYVSSTSHHPFSARAEKISLYSGKERTFLAKRNRANREVFTSMCSSALFPGFSGMHGDTGIYQKVFQLYSLYQVGVPVKKLYIYILNC